MTTQQIIEDFLEEQFNENRVRYLFYRDKQLLKSGDYRGFARQQLKHNRGILWSVSFSVFMLLAYGIWFLLEYGTSSSPWDLGFGLTCLLSLSVMLFFTAREYYTIKGSMSLLLKFLDAREGETTAGEKKAGNQVHHEDGDAGGTEELAESFGT